MFLLLVLVLLLVALLFIVLFLVVLSIEGWWVSHVRHLLLIHVGRNLPIRREVQPVVPLGHWLRSLRSQVLVWVESTKSHDVSQVVDRDHLHSSLNWCVKLSIWLGHLTVVIVVSLLLLILVVLQFFRHWRQGYSFGKVWQWVNQLSLFTFAVEERTPFSKFALAIFNEVFARHCFVVGVDSSQSSFSKINRKRL